MADVDEVLGNDITTPVAVQAFEKTGFTDVFDQCAAHASSIVAA
ncbi:MAG: hypothetical protein SOH86_04575 [Erysipelotrichaceae bacterium]|jgi:3-isopropylmalate/(R)-2-methylmalate dehydratase large subunit